MKFRAILMTISVVSCLSPTNASAVGTNGDDVAALRQAAPRMFRPAEPALAPFAHVLFCKRNPADCQADGKVGELRELDASATRELQAVNNSVNRSIRPTADASGPVGDVWTISPRSGDCEDYAVTKRHQLLALGWPVSSLRIAVGRIRTGEGHAILVVSTTGGDVVLDNRARRVLPVEEADITIAKIQSAADPKRWETFSTGQNVASNQ